MYYMYIEKMLFPITPGKITITKNGKNETFTLIDNGEVNMIKAPGLAEITIDEIILPGQKYPFALYEDENGNPVQFRSANSYISALTLWQKSKKPVKWKLIRLSPDGKKLDWNTNMDVTIEKIEQTEDAENGSDVIVSLEMKEYRYFGAKKLVLKKKKKKTGATLKNVGVKKKTRAKKSSIPNPYTVKKGDCMITIAKKYLGKSSRWKEIYNLNKSTVEAWAKKYGHKSAIEGTICWIFPGEKLKMPKE